MTDDEPALDDAEPEGVEHPVTRVSDLAEPTDDAPVLDVTEATVNDSGTVYVGRGHAGEACTVVLLPDGSADDAEAAEHLLGLSDEQLSVVSSAVRVAREHPDTSGAYRKLLDSVQDKLDALRGGRA